MKHKFTLFCLFLITIDLIVKAYVHQNFEIGDVHNWHNLLTIMYAPSVHPRSFSENFVLIGTATIRIGLRLLMIFLFVRMLLSKKKVRNLYRYAVTLIAFGAIGNFIDKTVFMKGDFYYTELNYFTIGASNGFYWNISSILILLGWILFFTNLILKKIKSTN